MALTYLAVIFIIIGILVILGAIAGRRRRIWYTRPAPENRVVLVGYNNGQPGVIPIPAPPPAYSRDSGFYPPDQNCCPVCGIPGDLNHVNHSPPHANQHWHQ